MTDHDPKLVRFDRRRARHDGVKFRFNVQRAKVTPALSVVGERAIAPAEFEFALDRFAERLVGQLAPFLASTSMERVFCHVVGVGSVDAGGGR